MTEQCLSTRKPLYAGGINASTDITSGTLPLERGGTESDLSATGPGYLYQASSGAVVTIVAADVSPTELGYVNGVTSAIQTQIDGKVTSGGALGTPSSGTLTNCSGLPIAGLTASTSTAIGVGSIELGHASDTTIARSGAGVVTIEGIEVVTTSGTQTLTNKTLTSPRIGTSILDANGNVLVSISPTGSAVNYIEVANAGAGGNLTITSQGADTDINLLIAAKGDGYIRPLSNIYLDAGDKTFVDANSNEYVKFASTASAVNEITITNAATAGNPKLSSTGGDTDIGFDFDCKGSGSHRFLQNLYCPPVTLTDGATINIDWSLSNKFEVLIAGNREITFSNFVAGMEIELRVQQDGAGSRLISTWPGGGVMQWAGGAAPTLATTGNHADIIKLNCRTGPLFDGGIILADIV